MALAALAASSPVRGRVALAPGITRAHHVPVERSGPLSRAPPQGFPLDTIHVEKYCEPPPYAWPSAFRAPST